MRSSAKIFAAAIALCAAAAATPAWAQQPAATAERLYVIECGQGRKAQLCIHHDKAQSDAEKKSPQFYD
jgi:hypothetical protein